MSSNFYSNVGKFALIAQNRRVTTDPSNYTDQADNTGFLLPV